MKARATRSIVAAASILMLAPVAVFGQSIFVGGGVTFPTGDYGDYADTGWMGVAGVTFDLGTAGLWVGGEGFYGNNSHNAGDLTPTPQDEDFGSTNLYGAMGLVGWGSGDGESLGFYVYGGAGLLVHDFSAPEGVEGGSESKFGYEAAAGVDFPLGGSTSLWGEGRFMGASDTTLFGIYAGLSFGIG